MAASELVTLGLQHRTGALLCTRNTYILNCQVRAAHAVEDFMSPAVLNVFALHAVTFHVVKRATICGKTIDMLGSAPTNMPMKSASFFVNRSVASDVASCAAIGCRNASFSVTGAACEIEKYAMRQRNSSEALPAPGG